LCETHLASGHPDDGVRARHKRLPLTCGPVSPYSGRDCVKSLRLSYTGLYPQTQPTSRPVVSTRYRCNQQIVTTATRKVWCFKVDAGCVEHICQLGIPTNSAGPKLLHNWIPFVIVKSTSWPIMIECMGRAGTRELGTHKTVKARIWP